MLSSKTEKQNIATYPPSKMHRKIAAQEKKEEKDSLCKT